MEWLCAVGGIRTRADLGNAYSTIRELIVDPPDPVRHVSIKRLTISHRPEKDTGSICIHSLAVPPDIDQLAQLVSMLITGYSVHVWAMGPELASITLSRFRDGVPIGSKRLRVDSIDPERLFGDVVLRISAMEVTHLPASRLLDRVGATFGMAVQP